MVSNGCNMLDGIIFDCVMSTRFNFVVGYVRSKAYVYPRVSVEVVMYVIVKEKIF